MRFIEIFVPHDLQGKLNEILNEFASIDVVQREIEQGQLHVKLLMQADQTETLLDRLEVHFTAQEQFRAVIVPVSAAIPRPQKADSSDKASDSPGRKLVPARISREELVNLAHESSRLTTLFVLLVILSSVVAAIGLLRNNAAAVIGAMVIAPLLGPNMALALAAALGDLEMARSARQSNLVGIGLPLAIAVLIGLLFDVRIDCPELLLRTEVLFSDVVLALAAGCAAALSFTTALSGTLIGVMVAVALLPPLVACGILLGAGQWQDGAMAGLLFLTNLICINLAGVLTFLVQGIRPLWWWDKQNARQATRRAMFIWITLFILLVLILVIKQLLSA